jgi:beta-lactamase regulating signal transducer with metallopeptidase domain
MYVLPAWEAAVLPALDTEVLEEGRRAGSVGDVGASPAPSVQVVEATRGFLTHPLSLVWIVVGLLLLLRLGWDLAIFHRLKRNAKPANGAMWDPPYEQAARALGLKRRVTMHISDRVDIPLAGGFLAPAILLPTAAQAWPEERRRVVLLHELAHIERSDFLANVLAQLACALNWFNPLAWLAAHKLRIECECACDDRVVATGIRASDYGHQLVEVARGLVGRSSARGPVLAVARRSDLEERLRRLFDRAPRRTALSRKQHILLVLLVAAAVLPLATFKATPTAAPVQVTQAEPSRPIEAEPPPPPPVAQLRVEIPEALNPGGAITVHLPVDGPLSLTIYDLMGKRVATLVDRVFESGSYRFALPETDLLPATYILVAQLSEEKSVRRLQVGRQGTSAPPPPPVETAKLRLELPEALNPGGEISVHLPTDGPLTLTIYDQQGNTVQKLVDRPFRAGSYRFALPEDDVPPGTYFLVAQLNEKKTTSRLQVRP